MADEISDHATAYDFVQLGEGIAESMTRASEELVQRAQAILDQTNSMADIIRTQVRAQAEQIEDMNGRFRAFGEQMLDAHRKLNGDAPNPNAARAASGPPPRVVERVEAPADIARLRALDNDIRSRRDAQPAGSDTAKLIRDHDTKQRQHRAQGVDGQRELPRPVATGEPHAPWVGYGKDRGGNTEPGTGTSSNGER